MQQLNFRDKISYRYLPPVFEDSIMTGADMYNLKGQLIQKYFYNTDLVISGRIINEYNSIGLKKRHTWFKEGDTRSTRVFKYDSINRLKETIELNPDGSPIAIETTTYYKNHLISGVHFKDLKKGKEFPLEIISYDTKDRIIKKVRYDRRRKLKTKEFYSYDEERNMITIYSDQRKTKISRIKTFDQNNRLIQDSNFENNIKTLYGYHENGLLHYKVIYMNNQVNSITRFVYKKFNEKPALIFPSRKL